MFFGKKFTKHLLNSQRAACWQVGGEENWGKVWKRREQIELARDDLQIRLAAHVIAFIASKNVNERTIPMWRDGFHLHLLGRQNGNGGLT